MPLRPARPRKPYAYCWLAIAIVGAAITGCAGGSARYPVDGSVTLDGQPIQKGQIIFVPMAGTSSPAAGAIIENGRYLIPAAKGVMAGAFRVEISAMRPAAGTNQTLNVVSGQMEAVEKLESIVPERYNRNSELRAEVKSGAANQFDFELKSQ